MTVQPRHLTVAARPENLTVTNSALAPLAVSGSDLGALLGLSLTSIRVADRYGRIPRPVKIGGAVRWSVDEIREWLVAGAPPRAEWEKRKTKA